MANKRSADPKIRVQEILTQFGVRTPPVPVDRIAKGLGAQLRFSPLDPELAGMIYVSENTPIIGVNSLQHPNRQRFTIAHEIAHLELHGFRGIAGGAAGVPAVQGGDHAEGHDARGEPGAADGRVHRIARSVRGRHWSRYDERNRASGHADRASTRGRGTEKGKKRDGEG